ncbi:UNVERIFIED_CONTAM: hypothetical protein K2H54_073418 [Gekko kuhli]
MWDGEFSKNGHLILPGMRILKLGCLEPSMSVTDCVCAICRSEIILENLKPVRKQNYIEFITCIAFVTQHIRLFTVIVSYPQAHCSKDYGELLETNSYANDLICVQALSDCTVLDTST